MKHIPTTLKYSASEGLNLKPLCLLFKPLGLDLLDFICYTHVDEI